MSMKFVVTFKTMIKIFIFYLLTSLLPFSRAWIACFIPVIETSMLDRSTEWSSCGEFILNNFWFTINLKFFLQHNIQMWRFIFLRFYVFSLCRERSLARNNFLEAKINLINTTDKLNSFEDNERKSWCNAYFKLRLRYLWCIFSTKQIMNKLPSYLWLIFR